LQVGIRAGSLRPKQHADHYTRSPLAML